MSDAFVESVGVNIHLSYYGTLYGNDFGTTRALLQGLGVRHVRDGAATGNWSVCGEDGALASAGIRFDVVAPASLDASELAWWITCIGSAAEAVEGPNEYDLSGNPNWVASLRGAQQALWTRYGSRLPVLSPALTSAAAYTAYGSTSGFDHGNMHDYFAGRNPGTRGWGGTDGFGTYGSLAWNMAVAKQVSASKPMIATETGYSDAVDQYPVPATIKQRYVLRTLLEHWNAGIVRTYLYELVDEGGWPFSHYGLVDASGNPKPAYRALANLLARLSDPGASFTPKSLAYTLSAPASVHHVLLQQRSGTYQLIIWNEVPEWDPNAGALLAAGPQSIVLVFTQTPRALQALTFDDAGSIATRSIAPLASVSLNVTGSPSIIEIMR